MNCMKIFPVLLFSLLAIQAFAQKDTTKSTILYGNVSNQEGKLLKGASVRSNFTKAEKSTNRNGAFNMDGIVNGDILYINYAGYVETVYQVSDRNKVTVILQPINPQDQMVNLLWYQKKKSLLTGAVTTITEKDLLKSPVINLRNAVSGRSAGLFSYQPDAEPGFETPTLNIRGVSSFYDNVVGLTSTSMVDGYERDFAELEPAEIDQLNILKDPISNAMYGIRGGRKAVYATTKRGVAYQNKISVLLQNGYQSPTFLPKTLDSYKYALLHNEASDNDGVARLFPNPDGYINPTDPYLYPNVDWYDEMLNKNAPQQRVNLTASGGTNTARYFLMLGLTNQDGLFKYAKDNPSYRTGQSYQRYNFRSNIDVNIDKNTLVQLDLNVRLEKRIQPNFQTLTTLGLWRNIANYPPGLFPVYNPNGSYGGNQQYQRSPVGYLKSTGYQDQDHRFVEGNAKVTRKLNFIAKGLSANIGFAFNTFTRPALNQRADFAVFRYNGPGVPLTQFGTDEPLQAATTATGFSHSVVVEGGLDYETNIARNHNIAVKAKYYQISQKTGNTDLDLRRQMVSGLFSYNFKEKYILDAIVSYSGSHNFAPGNRFGIFPAFGLGWVASKEKFLKNVKWLNYLKFRGSYGKLGSDYTTPAYPYESGSAVSGTGAVFGLTASGTSGLAEGALGNSAAQWMVCEQKNIGVDFELFNKVITSSVDLFEENVTGVLVRRSDISTIIGATVPLTNAGISSNRGIDVELKLAKPWKNNWEVYVKVMASYNKNKIEYQAEPVKDNPWEITTGRAIGQLYGLEAIGFFKDQADINSNAKSSYEGVLKPGDVKYKDQNNDRLIDFHDEIPLGKPFTPEIYYGAELGFRYSNFEFNILFTGSENRTLFLNNYPTYRSFVPGSARPTDFINDRWTPATASTATLPRLSTKTNNHNYRNSTLWMRNGRFVRLKDIELAYNFSNGLLQKFGLQSGRFFVNGSNLFTWSSIPDLDPESPAAGIDNSYPNLKVLNFGIRIEL